MGEGGAEKESRCAEPGPLNIRSVQQPCRQDDVAAATGHLNSQLYLGPARERTGLFGASQDAGKEEGCS